MTSRVMTWNDTLAAPVPRSPLILNRERLVEPEATDRPAARPWMHWPPGAALLVLSCSTMLFVAAFQSSVAAVRRDGLSEGLREGIEDTLPIQLPDNLPIQLPAMPAFIHPAKPAMAARPHHARHHHRTKLHVLLGDGSASATPWSQDREAQPQSLDGMPVEAPLANAPAGAISTATGATAQ